MARRIEKLEEEIDSLKHAFRAMVRQLEVMRDRWMQQNK